MYSPACLGLAASIVMRLTRLLVLDIDISPKFSLVIGSPFSAHDTSIGRSPFTTVQTDETASPQFAGSSLIENGAICGATENDFPKFDKPIHRQAH